MKLSKENYRKDDRPYDWVYKLDNDTVNGIKKTFHYHTYLK